MAILAGLLTSLASQAGKVGTEVGVNYLANKAMQEDSQEFNASQAEAQRDWASSEAQIARDWQTSANQIAMDFNSKEARLQRAWEEKMSSTSIRRMMRDMEKSGLNPILASQYSGASTPTGSVATAGGSQSAASPSGASASSSSNRIVLGNIFDSVKSTLTTAKKIHDLTDKIEHSYSKREQKQKQNGKSFDTDDFFNSAVKRAFEELGNE